VNGPEPVDPNVAQVLGEFLADMRDGPDAAAASQYETVVGLLRAYLEANPLSDLPDSAERAREAGAQDAVCRLCPPEDIAWAMNDFLWDFMPTRQDGGADLMRATDTVSRALAQWLRDHGYLNDAADREMTSVIEQAGPVLIAAATLRDGLKAWVESQPPPSGRFRMFRDQFRIVAVLDHAWDIESWLHGFRSAVAVPKHLLDPCQVDWEISGLIAKTSKAFRWVAVWTVYPS
jgi:hypothetical protein